MNLGLAEMYCNYCGHYWRVWEWRKQGQEFLGETLAETLEQMAEDP